MSADIIFYKTENNKIDQHKHIQINKNNLKQLYLIERNKFIKFFYCLDRYNISFTIALIEVQEETLNLMKERNEKINLKHNLRLMDEYLKISEKKHIILFFHTLYSEAADALLKLERIFVQKNNFTTNIHLETNIIELNKIECFNKNIDLKNENDIVNYLENIVF